MVDPLCLRCSLEEEFMMHTLVSYIKVQTFWFSSPLGLCIDVERFTDFQEWLASCIRSAKEEVKTMILSLHWI